MTEIQRNSLIRVSNSNGPITKVYQERWLMLMLTIIYMWSTGIHWAQFSSIGNIIAKSYNVSSDMVKWTTKMLPFIQFTFTVPCLYLQRKLGLRYFIITSSIFGFFGSLLKIYACYFGKFWMILLGQFFNCISYPFTCCFCVRLITTWFPNHEISKTFATITVASEIGGASGFLIPHLLVNNSDNVEMIKFDLILLQNLYGFIAFINLTLLILFLKECPLLPPSKAQALRSQCHLSVIDSIKEVCSNTCFLMVAVSIGLNFSNHEIFCTYLNEFLAVNFEKNSDDTGKIGFSSLTSGMIGSLIVSVFLDRTKQFKEANIFLLSGGFISMVLVVVVMKLGNILHFYLSTCLMMFFLASMCTNGFHFGIELTYPLPEEVVFAVVQIVAQPISAVFSSCFSFGLKMFNDAICLSFVILIQMIIILVTYSVPCKLNRQCVEKS